MKRTGFRGIIAAAFAVLCLGAMALPATAVGAYEFSEELSLRGNCSASSPDNIPDPSCPYAAPPNGPSGRFAEARSIAIDSYGNEYVVSTANDTAGGRIDVFDDEGHFITEIANPRGPKSVAVDSEGNMYVLETSTSFEADIVRYTPAAGYDPEAGEIEYPDPPVVIGEAGAFLGGLAIDRSNDRLYAGFKDFIREYSSAATGNTLLNTITNPKLEQSNWVAVDADRRRLFASFCENGIADCGVLVMDADAPYTILEELDGSTVPAGEFRSQKGWLSIAVDETTGHFFIEDLEQTKNIYEFNESFEYVDTTTFSSFQGGNALQIAVSNSNLDPLAKNSRYLFVPLPVAAGAAFAFRPPKEESPKVEAVEAVNISEEEAELRATIDPRGGQTSYTFEYVTQAEFEETEWTNATTSEAGTIPGGSSSAVQVHAVIDGLTPGTAYRFRVVAANGKGTDDDGPFGSFRTYADAPISGSCPNQIFRIGFSSSLPDCRAYELVTPADTNGRPPKGVGFVGDRFPTLHASPLGNAVSFVTEGGSIPGTEGTGGFNGDAYRASRGATGWATVRTGPTGTETTIPGPGSPSADQGYSFWYAAGEGTALINGQNAHYIRYPDGHAEPVGQGSLGVDPGAHGKFITEGGTHIIFQTENVSPEIAQQLEPNAPPTGTEVLYDRTPDGVTHVVSLLPGDVTPPAEEDAKYLDASTDGTGIAFWIERGPTEKTVYFRVDNTTTYEIGENIPVAEVSADGDRIFYVRGGNLYAFDVDSEEEIAFTETGNATVVNVAPDGSRAYFVSTTAIPASGENPNGDLPQAGQQNLYSSQEGAIDFVGTVTARDVEGKTVGSSGKFDGLGLWVTVQATQPARAPSRVDSDGSVLLFQSRANLTGYDSGEFAQIYRYDSEADRLHCISCIPTEAPATEDASLQSLAAVQDDRRAPFSGYGFVPNLRFDGKRAFFESTEALVSSDTDGFRSVYEWQEQGVGSCARPGGCIYLISSGHSANDNYLYGISRSGDDVFFTTEDVLVGTDNDASSIYDARVGGGFPEPTEAACEGEGCRPSLTPPPALTPPAKPVAGDDNVKPRKPRACPKGKRKVKRAGKVRCVKKKRGPKQKRGSKQRRGAAAKKGAGR